MAQEAVFLQHRWEVDPPLGGSWVNAVVNEPREVDLAAIVSPSPQQRLSGAQAVLLQGRLYGVSNREEALDVVLEQLKRGEENRHILLAMLSAAASLIEDPSEATPIWEAAKNDPAARKAMEPRFVRWKNNAPLATWRDRLQNEGIDQADLLVAVEGIGAVGDASDQPALERLLRADSSLLPVRLACSKALGNAITQGLEQLASELLGSDLTLKELMAANLLAQHPAPEAGKALYEIAQCESSPAQIVAYRSLAELFPKAARALAPTSIKHPDSTMRLLTVQLLSRMRDGTSLSLQAGALSDENTHVRRTVREHLERVAAYPAAREIVNDVITYNLSSERFEGIEQALMLAGRLNDVSRAPQMVALLDHPNPEVNVRAGWALQAIDKIEESELAGIVAHCQVITDQLAAVDGASPTEIARVAFCFEALGRQAYKPATDMLMTYVPKNSQIMMPSTRSSAIYALGYIFEQDGNPSLAEEFGRRILDDAPNDPEEYNVRYASAIALGRMLEPSGPESLEEAHRTEPLVRATTWALQQYETKGARQR